MKKIRIVIPVDPDIEKQSEHMLMIEDEYGKPIPLHEVGELRTMTFSTARGKHEILVLEMEVQEP